MMLWGFIKLYSLLLSMFGNLHYKNLKNFHSHTHFIIQTLLFELIKIFLILKSLLFFYYFFLSVLGNIVIFCNIQLYYAFAFSKDRKIIFF